MKPLTTKLLIGVGLWLLMASLHVTSAQTSADDEPLLKAAFVYNFAKFTRWPDNTWTEQNAPLVLCTMGSDKLADGLIQLGGKTIQEHPVTTRPLLDDQNPETCHLLYIAASEQPRYKDILKTMRGKPILTVSELSHFGRTGGIIELYREKDQTRFIINLGVAREAGLVLSARLLGMAVVIDNEERP